MKMLKKLRLLLFFLFLFSCYDFHLTDEEITAGLKSALEFGSKYALKSLGVEDGFYKDIVVKIGLPQDVATVVTQISKIPGFGDAIKLIEEQLILTINRAAEASIAEVVPIVVDAITDMTIQDAKTILLSSNNIAATEYLREKTYEPLCNACISVIEGALNKKIVLNTSAQDVWKNFTDVYNTVSQIPFVNLSPVTTDLAEYTTSKTLDGVFIKIGDEEKKIRTDINARTTDLLRRVFRQLD
ncbi:MAG: DUF4197 domain-containing protein [Bacteroidales bacterium]|jgi:hypothetical protein|nr:DUF4197 domain-containing protein [Bacteroidales bacterium]